MAPPSRSVAALFVALAASIAPLRAGAQGPAGPPPGDEGSLRRPPPPGDESPLRRRPPPANDPGPPPPARTDEPWGDMRSTTHDEGPLRRRERVRDEPPPPPARAPRLALWTGVRIGGELPVGDAFKDFNDRRFGERQVSGPGLALELDVGARLGRRFLPFVFAQRSFIAAGSASALPGTRPPPFTPPDEGAVPPEAASPAIDASSTFALGLGFRYEFNPEAIGPIVEIAYAFRKTSASFNTGQTLSAEAPGEVRIGVGASFRVADAVTLSPLVTFAAGSYSDVVFEGFDGRERAVAGETPLHGYLGLSLGAHADLFGKR
jgi:hypothetical protein